MQCCYCCNSNSKMSHKDTLFTLEALTESLLLIFKILFWERGRPFGVSVRELNTRFVTVRTHLLKKLDRFLMIASQVELLLFVRETETLQHSNSRRQQKNHNESKRFRKSIYKCHPDRYIKELVCGREVRLSWKLLVAVDPGQYCRY